MSNPCIGTDAGSITTIAYGPSSDQVGDLYVPHATAVRARESAAPARESAVICLLHGGFWRLPYGRDHIAPIALDLMARGYRVWNLEYRRVGSAGGGWPGTLQDVAQGIDHLANLGLDEVTVIGHSAGGHLALWAAGSWAAGAWAMRVRITRAVGLAPVADLALAFELGCGNGAVAGFLRGSPLAFPERYRTASPAQMLPLGVQQLLIHGAHDEDVPVEISRRYAKSAVAAGDDVRYIELADAGHMDFVEPQSAVHAVLCGWLAL